MESEKEKVIDETSEKKDNNQILMSQAEFEKRQRLIIKENINRVLRVAGLIAILFLVSMAIPTLFELSVFGIWIKGLTAYHEALTQFIPSGISDYPLYMSWVSVVLLTIILVAVILGIVYLITYNVVDLIVFFKHIGKSFKGATDELKFAVQDTMSDELPHSKKEHTRKEKPVKQPKPEKVKEEPAERRSENSTDELTGLSSEQLDALLRGEALDTPAAEAGAANKDLFQD